jgi:phage shock protein C
MTEHSSQGAQNNGAPFPSRRLTRIKDGAMLAGVCTGLGAYLGIDPAIIRLIFVLITLSGGAGIPAYIILWLILPEEGAATVSTEETINKNAKQMAEKFKVMGQGFENNQYNIQALVGVFLLVIGIFFIIDNFGIFPIFRFLRPEMFWPVILIIIGLILLTRKNENKN